MRKTNSRTPSPIMCARFRASLCPSRHSFFRLGIPEIPTPHPLKKLTDVSDFPKWLLALAGTNLIPILLCPFFLFGGLQPFGQSEVWILNFLLYLLSNLLWVAPLLLFFVGLQLYRRCFEVPGIIVNAIGALLTIVDIWLLCI